ncbi:hypothetical protein RK09_00930 [Kocuria rhizophila]|nr:hypothetical protein RK09_00930 [Kocuria rhizophila]
MLICEGPLSFWCVTARTTALAGVAWGTHPGAGRGGAAASSYGSVTTPGTVRRWGRDAVRVSGVTKGAARSFADDGRAGQRCLVPAWEPAASWRT